MEIKPYTPEMKQTFMRIVERGGSYSHHVGIKAEYVVSIKTEQFNDNPESDLLYSLWITDYDNFTRNWCSFSNPLDHLNSYIQNFLFQKYAAKDWEKHISSMKKHGII